MVGIIDQYRSQVQQALESVPQARIMEAVAALLEVHRRRGTVFVLCPPEDAGTVEPLVRELAQGAASGPFAFRLVRLYGTPGQVVAWQSEWAYEDVYVEQMRGVIRPGDVVLAVSRQGQSMGMVRALLAARRSGATTIAIVGYDGGMVKDVAAICLHVQSSRPEQIQDAQVMLEHTLSYTLRRLLSTGPGRRAG